MKKSVLKSIIKECIKEYLMEGIKDPTKQEMMSFLAKQFGKEEGFRDDAEAAIYWFANFNHGGQWSNLYSALSTSPFRPGRIARGPQPDSAEEMMYQALESEYGNKVQNLEDPDPDPDEFRQWHSGKDEQTGAASAGGFMTPKAFKKESMTTRNDLDMGTMKAVNLEGKNKTPWKEIDHGFFIISPILASRLCGGKLPRPGNEKLEKAPEGFKTEKGYVWVSRTPYQGKVYWSMRDAKHWRKTPTGGMSMSSDDINEQSTTANATIDPTDFKLHHGGSIMTYKIGSKYIAFLTNNNTKSVDGMSEEEVLNKITQLKRQDLDEQSSTASATPGGQAGGMIQTPGWVSKNKEGSPAAIKASKKNGYMPVKSIAEKGK